MKHRPTFLKFIFATVLLAALAYPAMLLATGAAMTSTSRTIPLAWGRCDDPSTPIGDATFAAGAAGTVTLDRTIDAIRVVSVQPADGWTFRIDNGGPGRTVGVSFKNTDGRVWFGASIVNCRVVVKVTGRVEATLAAPATSADPTPTDPTPTPMPVEPAVVPVVDPAPGAPAPVIPAAVAVVPPADSRTRTFPAAGAGSVELELSGGLLEVVSVEDATGWTHEVKKEGPKRKVRVRFSSDTGRVDFRAAVRHGKVVVWVRSLSLATFGPASDPAITPDIPSGKTPDPATTPTPAPGPGPAVPAPGVVPPSPAISPTPGETRTFPAGKAGLVTLERTGTTLEVLTATAVDGWTSKIVTPGPADKVSVLYTATNGFAFTFDARIDDGRFRIELHRADPVELEAIDNGRPEVEVKGDRARSDAQHPDRHDGDRKNGSDRSSSGRGDGHDDH